MRKKNRKFTIQYLWKKVVSFCQPASKTVTVTDVLFILYSFCFRFSYWNKMLFFLLSCDVFIGPSSSSLPAHHEHHLPQCFVTRNCERQSTVAFFFFWEKTNVQSNLVLSECFYVVCVSISIVDLFTKSFRVLIPFWWSHTCSVLFLISSFCCYCLRRGWSLFFWTFWDKLCPSCVYMDTYKMSVQKKVSKSLKKKVVVFVQILFFLSRQKILTLNKVDKE